MEILIVTAAAAAIGAAVYGLVGKRNGKKARTALYGNIAAFALFVILATVFMFGDTALAAGTEAAAAAGTGMGLGLIGAGLVTGLSCLGAGIAVANAAAAALGAISENEKLFGKSLIMVVLAEGIAIYGLLVSFLILNKI